MPAAPSEPEKYSIDEMMDRLQPKTEADATAEGELVTRPDGTQVVRVRKRKRRSNQPHKEKAARSQKSKIIQLSAVLILLILVALLFGGAVIYTNSPPFRENVVKKIATATGAKVDLMQFRMNPLSANAGYMILEWPEGNVLKEFKLQSPRAKVYPSSIFGGVLAGEEVTAGSGRLQFRIPDSSQPSRAVERVSGALPVNFKRIGVNKLNVSLGEDRRKLFNLHETEGSFYLSNVNSRPELRLNRGNLQISGWPALRMDRAFIEFRGQETDVISMRLLHEKDDGGIFILSGTILPFSAGKESVLLAQMESFQIAGIAGPLMARFLNGKIDSKSGENPGSLVFSPADPESGTLTVPFQTTLNSYLQLSGFSFLNGLAQTLEDKWFESPLFEQDSSGILERSAGAVQIRDIYVESKGRLSITGDVRIDGDKRLSGELHVGVASAMIAASPTRRLDAMFSEDRGGFRWIKLTLSGSAAAPKDNFSDLFRKVETTSRAPNDTTKPSPPSFEELTKPR